MIAKRDAANAKVVEGVAEPAARAPQAKAQDP